MNILVQIARVFVAVTFIFSGFVKLVDPLGSAYKFEEYFGADVLNMEFLIPYALQLSILLILAEIMLGVMLLFGVKAKLTIWCLAGLTLIFTFLTWYSAFYNKVTDCGCFGDAITLTPWETFYKNIILILVIAFLFWRRYDIHSFISNKLAYGATTILGIIFIAIMIYSLRHLPVIDFRAYAIGKNIPQGMVIPEGAEESIYEDTWIYKVDGIDQEFTTDQKPWTIEGATFVDRKTKLIQKGYEPPIHDFTMEMDGEDLTDVLLQKDKLMLIVAYNLEKSNNNGWPRIKALADKANLNGYSVYCFSASTQASYEVIKEQYDLEMELLFCDETTLKTIVRSNPGVVIVENGTITQKKSWRDTDQVIID